VKRAVGLGITEGEDRRGFDEGTERSRRKRGSFSGSPPGNPNAAATNQPVKIEDEPPIGTGANGTMVAATGIQHRAAGGQAALRAGAHRDHLLQSEFWDRPDLQGRRCRKRWGQVNPKTYHG
jgi:hypothetical protein